MRAPAGDLLPANLASQGFFPQKSELFARGLQSLLTSSHSRTLLISAGSRLSQGKGNAYLTHDHQADIPRNSYTRDCFPGAGKENRSQVSRPRADSALPPTTRESDAFQVNAVSCSSIGLTEPGLH